MMRRWQRYAAIVAASVAAYALAGFFGVPWLLRWQAPRLAASQLERQASIEAVRFNPFTLRLQVQGVRLAEPDGTPLVTVGDLQLRLLWKSIVRRAWSLEEVRIDTPHVFLAIAPDGQLNYARLLAALQRHRQPQEPSALPRLVVERFALEHGRVDMDDRQAGYNSTLAPISFGVERFSTLPEERDQHVFTAEWTRGGRVRWQGEASLEPLRASGQLTLEDIDLSAYGPYLKGVTPLVVAEGRLNATLPYRMSYLKGQLEAKLENAQVGVDRLALARQGAADRFASLASVRLEGVRGDLVRRELAIAAVRMKDGHLDARRDAKGRLDLAQWALPPAPKASAPAAPAAPAALPASAASSAPAVPKVTKVSTAGAAAQPEGAVAPWSLSIGEVQLADIALRATDETVQPPVTVTAERAGLTFQLQAAQTPKAVDVKLAQAALALEGVTLAQAQRSPLKLARLGFTEGRVDLGARRVELGRVRAEGGELRMVRDAQGVLDLLALVPKAGEGAAPAASADDEVGPGWTALVRRVELAGLAVALEDRPTGIRLQLQDVAAALDRVQSDLREPVAFEAGARLAEGGQLALRGQVVPAAASVDAQLQAKALALKPLQPLLAQYVKLRIAGGTVSTEGKLKVGAGGGKAEPAVRYDGGFDVAGLALNETDGKPFLSWGSVAASKFSLGAAPNRLEIPELRVVQPKAILIFENDRSFNAARLLVRPPAPAAAAVPASAAPAATAAADPFPVRIQRVRLRNAHLDFEDRSLRPQFGAEIHELNGVITGLSSQRDARSQIELDGRVGEFGMARVRGGLNPFVPRDNTDVSVIFRNVDLVPVSPYAMKFAGYRIAGGKVSLDLRYKVRDGRLEGQNQIVLDQLTLGERVDSPDALKLPLELAIAILKDSNGRIDLGLPVTGDMSDPQFSYGAIIWKAVTSLITKIVTAPFRAIGALLGISGEKLEAIDFDPGSSRLLPPEREKLKQVGEIMAKRAQLGLSVPAGYDEAADGAALRAQAVRAEIAKRAGMKLAPGEAPGPLDLADRSIREALRDLYAERFGKEALDRARKDAEAAPAPEAGASGPGPAQASLPVWQRALKFVQGEPQVADARAFYRGLRQKLEQSQALPPDALTKLAGERAQVVVSALTEAGVDAARVSAAAPAPVSRTEKGVDAKMVPLKLELALHR